MITLLALTVAIGLLVDDAIVVVEAVQNDVDAGVDATEAAHTATKRVALAVLAGALLRSRSLCRSLLWRGSSAASSSSMGLRSCSRSACRCWLLSTLTPALSARLLRPEHPGWLWLGGLNAFMSACASATGDLVAWAIRRRYLVLGGALASIFVGGFFAALVPSTFMASTDRSEFLATVKLPLGTGIAAAKAGCPAGRRPPCGRTLKSSLSL